MTVAFIGLGNMGLPMCLALVRAGRRVAAYDLDRGRMKLAEDAGASCAESAAEAAARAEAVVTVLPAAKHSLQAYLEDGVIAQARPGSILIDCSTIDVASARRLHKAAADRGHDMVDAPVSGGALRAAEGKLAITIGGTETAFRRAQPVLAPTAGSLHHMGPAGAGLAAKLCNNLVLAAGLAALSEAFVLGQRLGLEPERLFRSMSESSGQSWALRELCPVPGAATTSPANDGYRARGAASLLLKDLGIAQAAALEEKVPFPMGSAALSLYTMLENAGLGHLDVCAVIKMYQDRGDRNAR